MHAVAEHHTPAASSTGPTRRGLPVHQQQPPGSAERQDGGTSWAVVRADHDVRLPMYSMHDLRATRNMLLMRAVQGHEALTCAGARAAADGSGSQQRSPCGAGSTVAAASWCVTAAMQCGQNHPTQGPEPLHVLVQPFRGKKGAQPTRCSLSAPALSAQDTSTRRS